MPTFDENKDWCRRSRCVLTELHSVLKQFLHSVNVHDSNQPEQRRRCCPKRAALSAVFRIQKYPTQHYPLLSKDVTQCCSKLGRILLTLHIDIPASLTRLFGGA